MSTIPLGFISSQIPQSHHCKLDLKKRPIELALSMWLKQYNALLFTVTLLISLVKYSEIPAVMFQRIYLSFFPNELELDFLFEKSNSGQIYTNICDGFKG